MCENSTKRRRRRRVVFFCFDVLNFAMLKVLTVNQTRGSSLIKSLFYMCCIWHMQLVRSLLYTAVLRSSTTLFETVLLFFGILRDKELSIYLVTLVDGVILHSKRTNVDHRRKMEIDFFVIEFPRANRVQCTLRIEGRNMVEGRK